VCVVEWTYGGNMVLVNAYKEVQCVLENRHMQVMWCW